jgi:hypothetical protein
VVGYFPFGFSLEGKLLMEKIHYLPEPLHMMLKLSSSGPLIDDETREGISGITYFGVGLSVGFEMLDTAMRLGVRSFVVTDPDSLDQINQGRHTISDPAKSRWNKTALALFHLLRYNPYITLRVFYEGLDRLNVDEFFSGIGRAESIPIIVEEVDHFPTKSLVRYTPRQIECGDGFHTIMIADVGTKEVVGTYEHSSDKPFGERVAKLDPDGDPYGRGFIKRGQNMVGLLASIGGVEYIPASSSLHALIEKGVIGSEIATVPQDRGAVLQAAVVAEDMILSIARGKFGQIPGIQGVSLRS